MSQYYVRSTGGGGGGTVQTLTGDVGFATALGNNINVLANPSGRFTGAGDTLQFQDLTQVSPFVVDGIAGTAPYQTIQSAINDAAIAFSFTGNHQNVFVRPGVYTENLSLADNVDIIGLQAGGAESFSSSNFVVRLEGTHDPSAVATSFAFSNIFLQDATAIFQTAAAGTGTLYLFGCDVEVTNGYTFDLSAWVGSIYEDGTTQISGGQNGENSGTTLASMTFLNSQIGSGTAVTVILHGSIRMDNCVMTPESSFQNGSVINFSNSTFNRRQQLNGDTNGTINDCYFVDSTQSNLFFVGTGAFNLYNNTFDSTDTTVFDNVGTPIIVMSGCTFPHNNVMPTGMTLTYDKLVQGSSVSIANADSPYTVGVYESYISVDTSGGLVSVLLPNAPFSDRIFIVKDRTGNAAANPITVTTVGGAVNIDGAVTYPINTNYGSAQFRFNGSTYEVY